MINVMYVDDERDLLELGKVSLERSGDLRVDTAASVREAKEAMNTFHYDAIVSDYQMPEINGLQYLKMVREVDKSIPFILFTGKGREEVVIEACNSGVSFYLQKGGNPNAVYVELEHKIKQAAARHIAEMGLLVKRQEAQMAMDLAQVATFEYDEKNRLFKFDDIFFHLYRTNAAREGGYLMTPEKYFSEFVHPEDLARVLEFMSNGERSFAPDGTAQIQHRMVRRDGVVRDIIVRIGKIVLADNDRSIIACGVSHDITELKRAKEITEAHERCRLALNDGNDTCLF